MKNPLEQLPALPDQFRKAALALPDRVKAALPSLVTAIQAADALAKADAMSHYARRIRSDTESVNAINLVKLLLQGRLGELLAPPTPQDAGKRGGRGNKKKGDEVPVTLCRSTVSTYRKIGDNADAIEEYAAKVTTANAEQSPDSPEAIELSSAGFLRFVNSDKVHVGHNSGDNEWYTPAIYIDAARAVMGEIDCDPASSKVANKTVKATTFYTAAQDGLTQTWGKRVWLNPPYSQPLVAKFSEAIASKYVAGEVSEACVLVNNATETRWFQTMLAVASCVCFMAGRVKFNDPSGEPSGAPLQGQAILYFGKKDSKFDKHFSPLGIVLHK